jgi:hypothetical protein
MLSAGGTANQIPILIAIVQQVCGARGPRPRYPRVWKTRKKIGTISKSQKLVECVRILNVSLLKFNCVCVLLCITLTSC